jgi:hypothetical protein
MVAGDGTRSSHTPWAFALAAVAVVAIVAASLVYLFRYTAAVPGSVMQEGRAALADLREVAAAFRSGTITTTFRSYATEVAGTTRLQFAEVRQTEIFERRDEAAVLWGTLALPDVVVEARAPVEYTYYLDLDKEWTFRLEGKDVYVMAPAVEYNRPAVDVSALRYEVREESVLRDEQIALDHLRAELTALTLQRARQQLPLVRETGRRSVEAFVETWLVQRFADGDDYRARVRFADEPTPEPPRVPDLPTPTG